MRHQLVRVMERTPNWCGPQRTRTTSLRRALYFLKVYRLARPSQPARRLGLAAWRTVNIGVVFVDEGMVAVEIPVVERPPRRRAHRQCSRPVRPLRAGTLYPCLLLHPTRVITSLPRTARLHSCHTSLNLSRTECGLRGTIPGVPRPERLRHVTPRRTCALATETRTE